MHESFEVEAGVALEPDGLIVATEVLRELLARSRDGVVSTQALRKELVNRRLLDPLELIARLKSLDPTASGNGSDRTRWYHLGRSFLTEARFRDAQRAQEEDAAQAEAADEESADIADPFEEESEVVAHPERRKRRGEEARLGRYVKTLLEELYDDEAAPEKYVFDVHSARAGSDFENVDLLAVHWSSPECIEIITVEVKLSFTGFLVQQARNYTRFSERVWIAVPVAATTAKDAAMDLRAKTNGYSTMS